jgi:probable rRNA maturation factor
MPATIRVQLDDALSAGDVGVTYLPALRRLLTRAARAALRHENVAEAQLSVTLLDDDAIAALNREYLSHDGPTDVISFPLFEENEPIVGDVYIGAQQAARQAAANALSVDEELVRLTVHGVLHVLGYDHPDGEERLHSDMWQLQEKIVEDVVRR